MKYITAKHAQARHQLGLEIQIGQWVKSYNMQEHGRLAFKESSSDKVGKIIRPTGKKSVGVRFNALFLAKRKCQVDVNEPLSAHMVKGSLNHDQKVVEINNLAGLVLKANACSAILKESM